jgi:hypothetical protein
MPNPDLLVPSRNQLPVPRLRHPRRAAQRNDVRLPLPHEAERLVELMDRAVARAGVERVAKCSEGEDIVLVGAEVAHARQGVEVPDLDHPALVPGEGGRVAHGQSQDRI